MSGGNKITNLYHNARALVAWRSQKPSARKLLIKDGWKPIPMHTNDHYEYDGVEKELVRRKYMEVDSCSNDSARCVLYYRKKDACLRVDTIGEHVRGMKVVRWTDECPAPASPAAR